MLTVREAIGSIGVHAEEIVLVCGDNMSPGFDWRDPIMLQAFGDYLVETILATGPQKFELSLYMSLSKKDA